MKLLLAFILFVSPLFVSATVVSVTSTGAIPVDGTKLILISLDTEGETINAIEGDVVLPQEFVTITSVQDADSVISFWTETPSIAKGVVHFSGIIPGGFNGQGVIAQIEVSGVQTGFAQIRIPTFAVFLHDGEGTRKPARVGEKAIEVVASGVSDTREADTTPPEVFIPNLVDDDTLFEGKRVLIFATHDEQSGMSHYEVQETENDTPSDLMWVRGESPFMLSEIATKYVFVRAHDNAGNSTVVRYDGDPRSPLERVLYTLVFFALMILLIVVFIRRKHHHHARLFRAKNVRGI